MRRLCGFALVTLVILGSLPALSDELRLTVLHTNDVHSRLAGAIQSIRAEGGHVALLDAGDQFQGSLFFTYYNGQAAAQVMNRLGYDAMAVGNHEFDGGPQTLACFAERIDFPLLASNMDASADRHLAGRVAPWTVLEFGAERIGVIGLITEETPSISSPGPVIQFSDLTQSLKAAVAELEGMGIDKIIALGHVGYWRDMALARAVDGVDIIVGGHSHTYLSSTDPAATGPYPTLVTLPGGDTALIVQAYQWSRYLGRLDVSFDGAGRLSAWHGAPILMDNAIPEEPGVAALVTKLNEPLHEIRNEVVGAAAEALGNDTCRIGECALGNLVADIMLWRTAGEGSEIAIANGGGIRAGLPAGSVTRGDVLQILPFGNTLATFGLSGRDVVKALETGLARPGSGAFPHVAGLRYRWDPSRPAGSRVLRVEVRGADSTYAPLADERIYRLVSNNFLRRGGDGYEVLRDNAIDAYDLGPVLADAAVAYLAAHSPIAPQREGRISRHEE